MSSVLQDLRYALRTFAQAPGFTAVALVVLAIGIGGNTAMFTLVNAMLFQPMAGQGPDVVRVFSHDRTKPDSYRAFSYPNYVDVRDASHDVFDGVMAHTFAMAGLPAGDTLRRTFVELVSANYFDTLQRAAGRRPLVPRRRGAARRGAAGRDRSLRALAGRGTWIRRSLAARCGSTPPTSRSSASRRSGFGGTMALVSPEFWLPLGMFDIRRQRHVQEHGDRGSSDRTHRDARPGRAAEARGHRRECAAGASTPCRAQLESRVSRPKIAIRLLTVNPLPRMSTSTSRSRTPASRIAGAALMGVVGDRCC